MINSIKASGLTLSDPVRAYTQEKLGGIAKFADSKSGPVNIDVELERTTAHHQKGEIFRAEVSVTLAGDLLRAEATDANLYAAIDLAREEIIRELKSKKGRRESLFRRGSRLLKGLIRS